MTPKPSLRIGIDVGGTFTDAVVIDGNGSCIAAFKLPSTPSDPAEAVMAALRRIASRTELVDATVCHGTTVGTNALIERKGGPTALVTTRGFRDVLALRRQARPELYTFDQQVSEPLVPREARFEVDERVAYDGEVIAPLGDVGGLIETLRAGGYVSVAISLLHAYAATRHEEQIEASLRAALPDLFISRSSDVAPEIREFERTSTAVVNAYIGPRVSAYIGRLEEQAAACGLRALYVVKSSGGVTSPQTAMRYPVHLVESGPAAGLVAAAHFGTAIGRPNILAFDMGGTTANAGVVVSGRPRTANEFTADALVDGRAVGGYPILSAVMDVVEVGAGGGSVAFLDEAGILKVGPRSAGARPGPACYGLGGEQPTVTDAHAVIGIFGSDDLAEAGVTLDVSRAEQAIRRHIAEPLGWTAGRAAQAILDIAVANMAEMVRLASLRRGLDPRDFVLLASGGAGPLHAVAIARDVGMREVIVPPLPGMFSAIGAVLAPIRHDVSATLIRLLGELEAETLRAAFAALDARIAALLAAEQEPVVDPRLERFAEIRFRGQLFQLQIALGAPDERLADAREIEALFRAAYRAEYGFDLPDAAPELVTVRLIATAPTAAAGAPALTHSPKPSRFAPGSSRKRVISGHEGRLEVPLRDATEMPGGNPQLGPAIVAIAGATVWIPSGATARMGESGAIHIDVGTA